MNIEIHNFESFDFDKQIEIIKNSSFRDKADFILRSKRPEEIILSLSCEEFYMILKSSTTDLHPDILSHATQEQLTFSVDFECWDDDEINFENLLVFADKLNSIDSNNLKDWIINADFELIISLFIKYVEVIKTDDYNAIDEYVGDRSFFTIDNLYYIDINSDHYDVLRGIIDLLYENNKPYYITLLESIINEHELEMIEMAYNSRNERLAEYGFPDKEESLRIYKTLSDTESVEQKVYDKNFEVLTNFKWTKSNYPIVSVEKRLFIDQVLDSLQQNEEIFENIYSEFIWLANKIIVVENLDFKDPGSLHAAFDKAKKIVSLALEDLSRQKIEIAKTQIQKYWIEDLHRFGITYLSKLKTKANDIFKSSKFFNLNNFMRFLGHPWDLKVKGILKFYPNKIKELAASEISEFTDFESVSEVNQIIEDLSEINSIIEFFKIHFGSKFEEFLKQDFYELTHDNDNINMTSLLATLLVHLSLSNMISFEPLQESEIKKFIELCFDNSNVRKLKLSTKELLINSLNMKTDSKILYFVFKKLEDEVGNLNLHLPLDFRYVRILLTKHSIENNV